MNGFAKSEPAHVTTSVCNINIDRSNCLALRRSVISWRNVGGHHVKRLVDVHVTFRLGLGRSDGPLELGILHSAAYWAVTV